MLFVAGAVFFAASLSANPAVEAKQEPVQAVAQVQAPAQVENPQENKTVAQNDQYMGNQQNRNNNQQMMGNNCDKMGPDEKNFAAQLNSSNKNMFCNQFTPAQRKSAMQMMGTTGPNGMKMSADQSVEQVSRSGGMRSGGGCPVR